MSDETKSSGKNVVDLKGKKPKSDKKKPRGAFEDDVAKLVAKGSAARKYGVVEESGGSRHLVQVLDGMQITPISETALVSDVLVMCNKFSQYNEEFFITTQDAVSIKNRILYSSSALKSPPVCAFKSYDGYCYKRFDFDFDNKVSGNFKTWDIILDNIEAGKKSFINFIGSLFFEEACSQNYMWMFGEGGEGKSSIIRFLQKVFGERACVSLSPPTKDSSCEKWNTRILGKRIGFFPDCATAAFVQTSHFKGLTGGDGISIEPKFKEVFTVKNSCRFIFASNVKPKISTEKWSLRRLVYVVFKPRETIKITLDPEFEEKLWAERDSFIQYCMASYRKNYPNFDGMGGEDEDGAAAELAGDNGQEYEDFFDEWFGLECEEKDQVFNNKESFVYNCLSKDVTPILKRHFPKNEDRFYFYYWLEHVKRVKKSKSGGQKSLRGWKMRIKKRLQ